ncbi:MAG: hypothetical protein JSR91_19470 [Proteobacteria bacterium]|nr:hypothetical protein [Pseudomonadota bacterium]
MPSPDLRNGDSSHLQDAGESAKPPDAASPKVAVMNAAPDTAAIEHLRQLGRGLDKLVEDVDELKRRLTSIEALVAIVHRDLVGHSDRIDRVDARLEQIERCLEFRRI